MPKHALARNYISPNAHLAEITFPRNLIFQNLHLPECTFGRNYLAPKAYFTEFTLARMYIWLKLHFPENLYLPEFTYPQKIRFLETIFHSKNYTMFRLFISNKQNNLFVEIKKRCDNS